MAKKKDDTDFSPKWQAVIDLLLADPQRNASKAYQKIYECTLKIAKSSSSRLMKNVNFAAIYRAALDKLSEESMVSTVDVLKYWKGRLDKYDPSKPTAITIKKMTGDKEVVEIFKDESMEASKNIAKYLGMFKQDAVNLTDVAQFSGTEVNGEGRQDK